MNDIHAISEKYRKFLLEIIFGAQHFYTVSGADLSDNYTDKMLVDTDGSWLLCTTPADVLSLISKNISFFDNQLLQQWGREVTGINTPYATINLDDLAMDLPDLNDLEFFESVYTTLGIVKDYALQVNEEEMLAVFEQDALIQFLDNLADYFIWSGNETFKITVDMDVLHRLLKEIYQRLKLHLRIYQ